ncbi:MAG TPA: hypothetical protein VGY32_11540 [Solirubrobacteraceae bacterium]|jgi:hypothetical protein|nr:hypothetical protein [Solirubrobacteraceae bacterium]
MSNGYTLRAAGGGGATVGYEAPDDEAAVAVADLQRRCWGLPLPVKVFRDGYVVGFVNDRGSFMWRLKS